MFPPEQADLESKGIKAFSDVCIVQDKTRRVSSVIYHIHEVKKNKNKNLKTNVLRASQIMFKSYCIIVVKGKYTVGWWNIFRGKTYPPGDLQAGCV